VTRFVWFAPVVILGIALVFVAASRADRSTVPEVAGCPTLPGDQGERPGTVTATVDRDEVMVASDVVFRNRPRPLGAAWDLVRAPFRWSSAGAVVAPASGLSVEVFTDGPGVEVDTGEIDRLLGTVLTLDVADARLAALLECYRERVIDGGELAGVTLRVIVPSDPAVCLQGGRLLSREVGGRCDAAALMLPPMGLRPGTVVIAPGRSTPVEAERRAAIVLAHELVHQLDSHLGLYPSPWTWRAFEQRAHYVERAVDELDAGGEIDLPRPIRWPGTPYGAAP
jgi:hypothetical protein